MNCVGNQTWFWIISFVHCACLLSVAQKALNSFFFEFSILRNIRKKRRMSAKVQSAAIKQCDLFSHSLIRSLLRVGKGKLLQTSNSTYKWWLKMKLIKISGRTKKPVNEELPLLINTSSPILHGATCTYSVVFKYIKKPELKRSLSTHNPLCFAVIVFQKISKQSESSASCPACTCRCGIHTSDFPVRRDNRNSLALLW